MKAKQIQILITDSYSRSFKLLTSFLEKQSISNMKFYMRMTAVVLCIIHVVPCYGSEDELERQKKIEAIAKQILEDFNESSDTLYEGFSLKEDILDLARANINFPTAEELYEALRTQRNLLSDVNSEGRENLLNKVLDSLMRILNFYEAQLEDITTDDASLSIKMLKEIDDKHGKVFQEKYPLNELIKKSCDVSNGNKESICYALADKWKNRSGKISASNMEYWKPPSVLQSYINRVDNETIARIGDEKEGLWGTVNAQCQDAILRRCEIPYVCERTLMDPTPRSQYLLTHQIFQRLIVENVDCPTSFVTDAEIYANMSAKLYMEAQFLDLMDVPINNRDLFSELGIGFGALMGYINFFREDWLHRILSWQSESDYGCFLRDPLTPIGLISSDMGFKRRATKKELDQGITQPKEKCLAHFTAVSLSIISVYYDYLMDLRSYQLKESGHSEL
ncbi:hypothetical protein Bhyg_15046 [Pseudolycoriella hygida]|uniref:Uncharacterized protein n=1 Tax=Pseudolycoriella hygida TaxID=35572 RepID=A0A9Q0MR45_9DIPT|nr:hypothetical protein Bhyg_15046 [Pseudolycoriella hygida]